MIHSEEFGDNTGIIECISDQAAQTPKTVSYAKKCFSCSCSSAVWYRGTCPGKVAQNVVSHEHELWYFCDQVIQDCKLFEVPP